MKCDIIIPVWNLKDYTRRCVESIIQNTEYPYRLIVIDNGSEEETRDYLKSLKSDSRLPDYTLIRNDENLGYTKATNQGLKISKAEYVCLHNNDTIVTKGWLKEMVKVAESNPEIGIVNPASNNLGQRRPWYMSLKSFAEKRQRRYSGRYIEMATAIGFCYLVKRKVIDRIGILREDYGLGNFEDTEYCIRAARNGYKSVIAEGAYVWHAENTSFNLIDNYEEMFRRNQEMFYQMFGKPQRILYILTKKNDEYFKKLKEDTYCLAQKCNWIWVICKKGIGRVSVNVHSNIVIFTYSPLFFRTRCIYRILIRKKKFDIILIDDTKIFSVLQKINRFHRAKLRRI